jgi:hypothetical protein
MRGTPRRNVIVPERAGRLGWLRAGRLLVMVAAVAAGLCGGVEAAGSAPSLSSASDAVAAVPQVSSPSVSVPSVPVPSVSVPSAPTPSVPVPTVPVPSAPAPTVPAPSVPTPHVSTPSVPTPADQGALAAPSRPSPSSGPSPGSGGQPSAPSGSASPRSRSQDAARTGRGVPSRPGSGVRRAGGTGSTTTIPAIGTSPQAVRRALRALHGCVPLLSKEDRSLLRQRAGSGSAEPRSLAALSVSLGISRAAVLDRLRRAIRELRTLAQTTACAGTGIATMNPLTGASALFGGHGGTPVADRSGVLGYSAHGGPSSQRSPAPGSGVAPGPAAGEAGPGTGLIVALLLLMLALVALSGLASRRMGPFRRPRPRRAVTPRLYALATRIGFRYSRPRDALVLRGIGERFGPVLVRDGGRGRTAHPPLESGRDRGEVIASRRSARSERESRKTPRRPAGRRR